MISANIIDIDEKKIKELYSAWINGYDSNDFVIDRELYTKKKPQIFPSDSFLAGIDFPTWLGTRRTHDDELEFQKKRNIMVVGIDPLRNEKDFKGDKDKDVVIGTPYALHLKKLRDGKTKQYWKFIEHLSKNNFIYLTDIYKLFFYTDNTKKERSYNYYDRINKKEEQKLFLIKEIELIKPDLIIVMGAKAYIQLMEKPAPKMTNEIQKVLLKIGENNIDVIAMVHLSGSTRKNTKIDFLNNNKIPIDGNNFGEGYFKIIENYFKTKVNK